MRENLQPDLARNAEILLFWLTISPTLCLNPPLLMPSWSGAKSGPLKGLDRKRDYESGSVRSQRSTRHVWSRAVRNRQVRDVRLSGQPAERAWAYPGCAIAWRVRRRPAKHQPVFRSESVRFVATGAGSRRSGSATDVRRERPSQGCADPAFVGRRQCWRRRGVDEERVRDGARGISQSQSPASDQG